MSVAAMTWVLGSTVGDRARKLILIELADGADSAGRHAWPSVRTMASAAECSPRTVHRHIPVLLEEGWIREGDQQQVAHLRADRRPVVYDLAMTEATRVAWAAQHSARGVRLSPRTASNGVPPAVTPPKANGVTHGVTETAPRGDTAVSHKPSTNLRTSPQAPSGGCARPGPTPHANCRGCGTTNRQIEDQRLREAADRRRAADRQAAAAERAAAATRPPADPETRRRAREAALTAKAGL